ACSADAATATLCPSRSRARLRVQQTDSSSSTIRMWCVAFSNPAPVTNAAPRRFAQVLVCSDLRPSHLSTSVVHGVTGREGQPRSGVALFHLTLDQRGTRRENRSAHRSVASRFVLRGPQPPASPRPAPGPRPRACSSRTARTTALPPPPAVPHRCHTLPAG